MNNSPCYNCSKHSEVCHVDCVAYREWRAELDKERAARIAKADADSYTVTVMNRIKKRINRRKR